MFPFESKAWLEGNISAGTIHLLAYRSTCLHKVGIISIGVPVWGEWYKTMNIP